MTDYRQTLNLPKTEFPMRAGLARKEPEILARWEREGLYDRIREARAGGPRFVFHDGPPYANGHLHHGHILNKILKDIVVKDRTMRGFQTGFVPGWDCHGLPIEVQVDKELGSRKATMDPIAFRRACADYARRFVDIQRDEFRRLGVLARWDVPYLTMDPTYEAQTIRELATFADAGLLYKGLRPVNWCIVHRTALAEAEVEYDDRRSPSVYVAFEVVDELPGVEGPVDLVIWTTTPWTLPANLAIAVHPDLSYVAYPIRGRLRVVAEPLLAAFLGAIGAGEADRGRIAGRWRGGELEGLRYRHALVDRVAPVVLGTHVTLDAGTGCVHTAPGHGSEDFEVGRRYGLDVLSPVDEEGVFTEEAGTFAGLRVFEANSKIVRALDDKGVLLNRPGDEVTHRYAHCWRCHEPIILRATAQWWVAVDRAYGGGPSLRERALSAIDRVTWIPPWGKERIRGMLEARPDWCLSRQRAWGVPIPVVYCVACDEAIASGDRMRQVAEIFSREGADAWYARPIEELMPGLVCPSCGGSSFRKETDILDVWFESGVSWAAVVEQGGLARDDGPPVDLYLEGSDQHRGWFHSSLLCGLATRGRAPFREVLTHGFVVDGEGKKISKSKGNFVDPFETIDRQGAELLRLWVAGEDYREDIRISPEIVTRLGDGYRKLRNTLRFLLGNVSDFDPDRDAVDFDGLEPIDRYALARFDTTRRRILEAYEAYAFHTVMQKAIESAVVDLSAFYLDVLKDRLYASHPASRERRSAQTVLYVIARDFIRLLAPVMSFTAEEAWGHLPKRKGDPESVHLCLHPGVADEGWMSRLRETSEKERESVEGLYLPSLEARAVVLRALEEARRQKLIGSSTEASVVLGVPKERWDVFERLGSAELATLFIVSKVEVHPAEVFEAEVHRAPGRKCARCWLYREDVGASGEHPELCARCAEVVCALEG